jgi:hypothetical protein
MQCVALTARSLVLCFDSGEPGAGPKSLGSGQLAIASMEWHGMGSRLQVEIRDRLPSVPQTLIYACS